MTPIDRLERHLPNHLNELAGEHVPDYFDDLLQRTAARRQRPRWSFPERWIPMALMTHDPVRAHPGRQALALMLLAALALTLMGGAIIAGARLLQSGPPPLGNDLAIVPAFDVRSTIDTTSVDGLRAPSGLAVGPNGELYVVNGTQEIVVIAPDGRVLDRWGTLGSGPGQFSFLWDFSDPRSTGAGVAVADDGSIYVADFNNHRVQQFGPLASGRPFIREWGTFGTGDGQFLRPYDVAVGPDGDVYVADDGRADIQRFRADGTFVASVGGRGTGDGQFSEPTGIAVTDDGTLLAGDVSGTGRVQAFDPEGRHLWTMGSLAMDVAVDAAGDLLVTGPTGLSAYSPDRVPVTSWSLPSPSSDDWMQMAVRGDTAYVSSQQGDAIYRLSIGSKQVDVLPSPMPSPATASQGTEAPSLTAPSGSTPVIRTVAVGAPFAVSFSVQIPDRWSIDSVQPGQVSLKFERDASTAPAWISVTVPGQIVADPCHPDQGMVADLGPSVDDLVAALTGAPGFHAGPVEDVVVDGRPGRSFELDNTVDVAACQGDPWLYQWTYAIGDGTTAERQGTLSNTHQHMVVTEVDGSRVLISALYPGSHADEVVSTQEVMDSIDFR